MTSGSFSKREWQLREHLCQALKEVSIADQKYMKTKYVLEWMEENRYLVPEKLMKDRAQLEKDVQRTNDRVYQLIRELDEFKKKSYK